MDRSVGLAPIEQGFIGIGWSELGDLSKFTDRDSLKTALKEVQPTSTESSIRTQSSPLFRFINEMKLGDYVV
ncbi:hypothetical protein [Acinetobacter sp. UBA3132]|nr:hypothetical protein [Acinetobacter sp. UBA3132]